MTTRMNDFPDRGDNRWRPLLWGTAACLLALPWIGMRFSPDVAWTPRDFVLFGGMLLAACGAFELAAKVARRNAYRAASGVAVGGGLLLMWMNLAVGIIGNEDDPLNLMFAGVIAVGTVGALLARFRPSGMARALVAMAIAQGLVAVVAQVLGHFTWILSAMYVALWLTSARLFRKAAVQEAVGAA